MFRSKHFQELFLHNLFRGVVIGLIVMMMIALIVLVVPFVTRSIASFTPPSPPAVTIVLTAQESEYYPILPVVAEELSVLGEQTPAFTEEDVLDRLISLTERMEDLHEWQSEVLEEIAEDYIPYYTNLGVFRLSAYCLCFICTETYSSGYESNEDNPNPYAIQVTASGSIPTYGRTIAADRRFPIGMQVYIEGLGWRTVEDRGGAITEKRFDIFMPGHQLARNFGVQHAQVRIRTADLDRICSSLFAVEEIETVEEEVVHFYDNWQRVASQQQTY